MIYRYPNINIGQLYSTNQEKPWRGQFIKKAPMIIQVGSGIDINTMFQNSQKILEGFKQLDNVVFGKIGTQVSNTISEIYNKNPNWKPGFAGERHAVLPTEYGLTRANYAGPGTKLTTRLKRRDQSVDGPRGIDAAAQKHDIRYALSKNHADIRKADDIFIDDVRNSTQKPIVKKTIIAAIKAKKIGEDVGLIDKNIFVGKGKRKPKYKFVRDIRKNKLKPAQILKNKAKLAYQKHQ